jgi:Na+-driven multidrug efflux pump
MKHAYRFKVIFALAIASLYFALCQTIPHNMIAMMTTGNAAQEEIVAVGSIYLRIGSWSLFPFAVSSAIGTSFREIARPKVPLIISAVATVINTLGNWILIFGNLGAPRLEVTGAAYATIIARSLEVAIFLIYAHAAHAPFFVGFVNLIKIHKKLISQILVKSAMIFISELSWISSETIMIIMYNRRGGAEVVAGMAGGWAVANIFFLLFGGIWITSGVLVGGALGAGKLDEARRRAEWLKSGAVVMGILFALPGAAISAAIIPLVFSNLSEAARANSLGLVLVILVYLPLWCLLNVQFAVTRAGGDTATGMYTDLLVNTLLFVPAAIILSLLTSIPPVPMFALLKITDIAKLFICRYFMRKERWVRRLTHDGS